MISVLRTTGISDVEAEELAILPGMEELSAMMYINQYRREKRYDVIVLDAAPTAESMRFISMPTTLDWYMKHIFPFQRNLLKAVRPDRQSRRAVRTAHRQLLRQHPQPLREARRNRRNPGGPADHQRAAGHQSREDGAARDAARLRLFLAARADGGRGDRQSRASAERHGRLVQRVAHLPGASPARDRRIFRAGAGEASAAVCPRSAGQAAAARSSRKCCILATRIPSAVTRTEKPYTFRQNGMASTKFACSLPFATKGEIGLFKKGDELVVEVGTLRRHIGLPRSMAALMPARAKLENRILTVEMKEAQ